MPFLWFNRLEPARRREPRRPVQVRQMQLPGNRIEGKRAVHKRTAGKEKGRFLLNPKRRIFQKRQRQLRRRKNVSFKQLSVKERRQIASIESGLREVHWDRLEKPVDRSSLADVERSHEIKFTSILPELRSRFPKGSLVVLDESCGRSSLKNELLALKIGVPLSVIRTDIRQGQGWPDVVVNTVDLVNGTGTFGGFGKNKFHLVVSTGGSPVYTVVHEKLFYQLVSVLKPGGIGIVEINIPGKELARLAKRLNISIRKLHLNSVVFTKNLGRRKR